MPYLQAFTDEQRILAKRHLATQVAQMMGRKLEEGDWSKVYCSAKQIPDGGWSNLHIDVNYQGLGLELKLLRVTSARERAIKTVCGTTLMHPAATRSIRIDDTNLPANDVMRDVFRQYAELIATRTQRVREVSPGCNPDMRTGWLIWEDSLTEFLYFEERMVAPDAEQFTAEWNVTPAQGARKASKSLWIYERDTHKKRYSVTTSAGIKIQPYFDVPPPNDPNLCYFRVQGEPVDANTVRLWISAATAELLRGKLGSLDSETVSRAIEEAVNRVRVMEALPDAEAQLAVGVNVKRSAYQLIVERWEAVSDEHRAQLLLKALE